MKPAAYPKLTRLPSSQNDTSPCSSTAPNDLFISQKMDYIEHFLSKFDDRLAKLEVTAKPANDNQSFSSQKKSTENSCLDFDHKLRVVEDGLFLTKNETSKRLSTLEDHIKDLTKKAVHGMNGLPPSRSNSDASNSKQGEYNIHDRISGIERRVDGMDKRLEQLTSSLESFMQRIEGTFGAAPVPQIRQESRREIRQQTRQGEEDRLTEVRLLGSGSAPIRDNEGQNRFEESYQRQRRGISRDVIDSRDRIRDIPDQSGRFRDEIKSPESQVERVERNEGSEIRKFVDLRTTPVREPVEQIERRNEGKYSERPMLDLRPPVRDHLRETKGSLKSPDTERKRKNVSWIESLPSEGNVEVESSNKRSKIEICEDEVENLGRSSLNQSLNGRERERPRSAIKPRERAEDTGSKYKYEGRGQRAPSASREEGATSSSYMRYSGEFRREKVEERTEERVESDKGTDKERVMEEKRKKIDEEIERRISKQIELKKKADVAVEGQRKIYEKASQIEDDFKISPYSTEKSRDKEVVSRLVREKQMRSDLICKYSENAPESGRKSKSPLRK